ncbi:MAG: 3'(2'),5'-bisphosphate nucleotidase CysQ [Bacteroidota bacterium]
MDSLTIAIKAAIDAGRTIKDLYDRGDIDTQIKDDLTPVTNADLASNTIIMEQLSGTGIPVLSEENKSIPYKERKYWDRLWIVDPLDGTKEFLKENGEFTVNIALIEEQEPFLGVIYAPVTAELYFACSGKGSFKTVVKEEENNIQEIIARSDKLPIVQDTPPAKAAVSRSHMNELTRNYIMSRQARGEKPLLVSRGSSLKICMVAEGSVAYYPRFGPTMEWDTAAGHAIARYAGKALKKIDSGEELSYNKDKLLNPDFIAE